MRSNKAALACIRAFWCGWDYHCRGITPSQTTATFLGTFVLGEEGWAVAQESQRAIPKQGVGHHRRVALRSTRNKSSATVRVWTGVPRDRREGRAKEQRNEGSQRTALIARKRRSAINVFRPWLPNRCPSPWPLCGPQTLVRLLRFWPSCRSAPCALLASVVRPACSSGCRLGHPVR